MKKYSLLFAASLVMMCWSCKDDEKKDTALASITLNTPAADAVVDLNTVDNTSFTWEVNGTVDGGYTLHLATNQTLADSKTYTTANTSVTISTGDMNTQLAAWSIAPGAEATVWWSVTSTKTGQATPAMPRSLKVKRISDPLPPEPDPAIELGSPAENARIELGSVENLTLSWTVVPEINEYKVLLSTEENFTGANVWDYAGGTGGSLNISAEELNELLLNLNLYNANRIVTLYWTVRPADAGIQIDTQTQSIIVARIPALLELPSFMGNLEPVSANDLILMNFDKMVKTWDNNSEIDWIRLFCWGCNFQGDTSWDNPLIPTVDENSLTGGYAHLREENLNTQNWGKMYRVTTCNEDNEREKYNFPADKVGDYWFKFDIKVEEDLKIGKFLLAVGNGTTGKTPDNNPFHNVPEASFRYEFDLYSNNFPYTDGWRTVTLNLTDFYKQGDTSVKFGNNASLTFITEFRFEFENWELIEKLDLALDNFRLVRK